MERINLIKKKIRNFYEHCCRIELFITCISYNVYKINIFNLKHRIVMNEGFEQHWDTQ